MANLNTHEPDRCCGKHLAKALLKGSLDSVEHWDCPICGCEWKPKLVMDADSDRNVHTIRHWEPHPVVMVFPL